MDGHSANGHAGMQVTVTEDSDIPVKVEGYNLPDPPKQTSPWWPGGFLHRLDNKWDAIRHFSAGFFISATCTGLIALLFYANPYLSKGWTVPLAWGFWWLSMVQFMFILTMLVLRCILFWPSVTAMGNSKSVDLFFVGSFCISFAILCEGFVRYMPEYFGAGFYTASAVLWWICASCTLVLNVLIPFIAMYYHSRHFKDVVPVWMVGFVPGLVTGLVGPIIAEFTPERTAARHIIYMSYLLLGFSFPVLMMGVTIVLAKLLFFGLPPPHFVMSLLFPTAPLALIADACVELMEASQKIFTPDLKPLPYLDLADPGLMAMLTVFGLFWFGAAMWWLALGLTAAGVECIKHRGLPYSTAWWGSVFPLGLLGLTALRFGVLLSIDAFTIVGIVLSIITAAMWVFCTYAMTVRMWNGEHFRHAV